MEELLCLMYHHELEQQLDYLAQESARIASLGFADRLEQEQALNRLRLAANAALDRFHTGGRALARRKTND